jgi:hypothetical protein
MLSALVIKITSSYTIFERTFESAAHLETYGKSDSNASFHATASYRACAGYAV